MVKILVADSVDRPQSTTQGARACGGAIHEASGDYVVIQDADLKYDDPGRTCEHCPARIVEAKADVVYGSRFLGGGPHRVLYFWHSVGNSILTLLSNCLTNVKL